MPAIINSDDGVVSGSAGLKTSGANDGILALQNNGTTNVTVTAAGNVGVGTTSPSQKLHVVSSASQVASFIRDNTANASGGINIGNNSRVWTLYGDNSSLSIYDTTANLERAAIDSSGNFKFNSGYGSVATAYGCRAWVNFNGTGTVAIRASGNVSSITDDGTGQYGVNFTTAMPDTNYAPVSNSSGRSTATTVTSTSRADLVLRDSAGTLTDYAQVFVSVFR
jgi:hypothetical protein